MQYFCHEYIFLKKEKNSFQPIEPSQHSSAHASGAFLHLSANLALTFATAQISTSIFLDSIQLSLILSASS